MVFFCFVFFCCFATNTGRNVSRSLRSSSSWLHLLWNPKCVPAAEGAATYSYFSFSPPEKEPCQHQGRLGSAGENPGEMHPGLVSLRWFPMRDVSQAGRQPVPGSCSAGSEEAGTEPREGLLSSFLALPLSAAIFPTWFIYIVL